MLDHPTLPAPTPPANDAMTMVISRTPYRVSFFGGGSDYPAWYREHGGAVLSTAINKHCYISCRYLPPFFENRHRIVWSHIETVNTITEILHPAVRAGLQMMGFDDSRGIELHHQGDLPARTGIGSSSAFAVGLINALAALRGQTMEAQALALAAIDLEQNRLQESVGSQDQVASAHGGFNVIRFATDGAITLEPVAIDQARRAALERRLMMFYTGRSRLSSALARQLIENLPARAQQIRRMNEMVRQAVSILRDGDLDDFGRLLHESWQIKRELVPGIATGPVDEIYLSAMMTGALGGKLLGSGGSGFMVFYVPEDRQDAVRSWLHNSLHVPFAFEATGSTIMYRSES